MYALLKEIFFLSLISTGKRYAVASRGNLVAMEGSYQEFRKRKRWEVEDAKAEKERLGALKVELLRRKEVKDASDTAEIEFEKIDAGWHSFAEKMCLQWDMYPSVAQSLGLNKIVPCGELQKA